MPFKPEASGAYAKRSSATLEVHLDGAWRQAGWVSEPEGYTRWPDPLTRFGPALPFDHWSGGSEGGSVSDWDPYLRPTIEYLGNWRDEKSDPGKCWLGSAKKMPQQVSAANPAVIYVRCNVRDDSNGVELSIQSLRLYKNADGTGGTKTVGGGACATTAGSEPLRYACTLQHDGGSLSGRYLLPTSILQVRINNEPVYVSDSTSEDHRRHITLGVPPYPYDYFEGGAPGGYDLVDENTFGPCEGNFAGERPIGCQADPVSGWTGSFVQQVTDASVSGHGIPFTFTRNYTSADSTVGPLGRGWSHNLDARLEIDTDANATLFTGDGQQLLFEKLPDGTFRGRPLTRSTLEAVTGGYELTLRDRSVLTFDSDGLLTAMVDNNGQGLSLAYDTDDDLDTVTDAAGREVEFTHDTSGHLTKLELDDGRGVEFAYTSGLLTSVTDLRGGTTTYTYDTDSRLDEIEDQLGNTLLKNTYGTDGRVTSQEDAMGEVSTFTWDDDTRTSTMTDARGHDWVDGYLGGVLEWRMDPLGNITHYAYDDQLNLTSITDPLGRSTTMTYDDQGNLLTRTDPAGEVEGHEYDTQGNLISFTDRNGAETSLEYDANGNITEVTEDDGSSTLIDWATSTWLPSTVTDAEGNEWEYTHNSAGQITEIESPLGNKTTNSYDSRGFLASRTDPRGNQPGATPSDYTESYSFDDAGNLLTVTAPSGATTTYTYDAAGRSTSVEDALGNETSFQYNAAGELTKITHANDGETEYDYDASGNLTEITDASGATTTYAYDDAGRLISETNAAGNPTTYSYDAADQLTSESTPTGATTTYEYDASGRVTAVVLPRGNATGADPDDFTWDMAHDPVGNLTQLTDPLGNTTTSTFDHRGKALTTTDPASKTTTYTYDGLGNLITEENPMGNTTQWNYDDDGRLTSETNPLGQATTYGHDAAGNLTLATSPLGSKTTYTHDALNRIIATTDPRGNTPGATPSHYTTSYTYDAVGNHLTTTNPLGATTSYTYDDVRNLTKKTDPLGRATTYDHDVMGRLTKLTAPDGAITSFQYDDLGNMTKRTDANNHATTFTYDDDGRLTSETTPLGNSRSYDHDADGNVIEEVDPRGNATPTVGDHTITRTFDEASRLTAVDYSDTTPDVSFSYDVRGLLTQMVDGVGTESRTYDDAARLTGITRGTAAITYDYDAASQVTKRAYPNGKQATYTFDNDGRMATVADPSGSISYAYDPASNLIATTRPNSTTSQWTYDRAGRPSSVAHAASGTPFATMSYTYDAVGNPTAITGPLGTTTLGYDDQGRITTVCYQPECPTPLIDASISYTYDGVGNRLTETTPTGVTTHAYDADDRLTTSTELSGTTAYTYDAAGNQLTAGPRISTYDLAGLTTSITDGSATTTYTYDGHGKRTTAGATTFTWDPNTPIPMLVQENTNAGALIRHYTHGVGLENYTDPTATSWYHTDAIGNVISLTDANGLEDWSYTYHPFGQPRTTLHKDPLAPAQPLRFTGQYQDPTGLLHLRARQYDPTTGRFTATDPLPPRPNTPHINTYTYADNRPTTLTDPTGLRSTPGGFLGFLGDLADSFKGWGDCIGDVAGGVASVVANPVEALRNLKEFGDQEGWGNATHMTLNPGFGVLEGAVGYHESTNTREAARHICSATISAIGAVTLTQVGRRALTNPSGRAPGSLGAIDDASRAAAFRAADTVDEFTVSLKHQPWASGNYAKFAEGVDQRGLIREALRSDGARFLPNNRPGSFRVVHDFGRPIGTRGETGLRVVVGDDGRIWTAFPVKP